MSLSRDLYKLTRLTGRTASTLNDIENIAKGHPERVAKKQIKRQLHKSLNKSINKIFK